MNRLTPEEIKALIKCLKEEIDANIEKDRIYIKEALNEII